MAPPDTIWHKESLKLKEIFGTREGFEICPNKISHHPIKAPPCTQQILQTGSLLVSKSARHYPQLVCAKLMLAWSLWGVQNLIFWHGLLLFPTAVSRGLGPLGHPPSGRVVTCLWSGLIP